MIFAELFLMFPVDFEVVDDVFFLFELIEGDSFLIFCSLVHFFVPVDGFCMGFEFFVEEGDELVGVDGLLGETELRGLFVHDERKRWIVEVGWMSI